MGLPAADRAARMLRVPLATVDNQRAQELLAKYRSITVYQANNAYRRSAEAFFVTTREEFLAVAEAAVLEAFVRYRAGDQDRERVEDGGMRAWVRRIVRDRLADYSNSLKRELGASSAGKRADAHNGVLRGKPAENASPAAQAYSKQAKTWMKSALGRLEPRDRAIVTAVLFEDETFASIGSALGFSKEFAWRRYRRALEQLRASALAAGIDNASFEVE